MNQLISAIGITVVSACCLQAANNGDEYRGRLGAVCAQVVLQHIGYVKTDSDGREVTPDDIDAAKLGLIQTNKLFKNLLDRQRINDAPITDDNEAQYPCINTQVIYNKTDKIIWDDNVTKYVFGAPYGISISLVFRILKPNVKLEYVGGLVSGDDHYHIYFIRDRKFFKDFTVSGEYIDGINGGFFMFKLPRSAGLQASDYKVYSSDCDEMSSDNPAYIFVDDEGKTSPVSNIKDDTKISQPGVNKVLARRVEFRKFRSSVGLFDAVRRDALLKVFDEVCGPKHGNRFMLDNATKRKMAVDVLKGKGRQLIDIENEVTIGDCLNGRELTVAEKIASSAILWRKIQSFRGCNLSNSEKAEMADIATTIGLPMMMPTFEDVLGDRFTVREISYIVAFLVREAERILNRSLTEDERREILAIIARR